jgi:glycosyltransferase involved in cell wall biosynthesis
MIADVVRHVRHYLPLVFVVDDGSTDSTAREAKTAGAHVFLSAQPQGKGAALGVGWTAAMERSLEWALLMDGDGQHDPADIPLFLDQAKCNEHLIIGNRMHDCARMPPLRRVTNRWLSVRISKLAEVSIPDTQCGFRLVHLPSLGAVTLTTRYFEIESEMCFAFARAGFAIGSVEIHVRYGEERSKIAPVIDTLRWLRWYWNARRQALQSVTSPPTAKCGCRAQTRPAPAPVPPA